MNETKKKTICAAIVLVALLLMAGLAGGLQRELIDEITAIIGGLGCVLVAAGAIQVGKLDEWEDSK